MYLTCKLGAKRDQLREYKDITDLQFEIQVRTVLQHAWAELAHDRAYKFGGSLPEDIQRRINLCAASLEMMDREFVSIVAEIANYGNRVASQSGDVLLSLSINSVSLSKYLADFSEKNSITISDAQNPSSMQSLVHELSGFGLTTIGNIDHMLTEKFVRDYKEYCDLAENTIGFLRTAMMYSDINKYFLSWEPWQGIDRPTRNLLARKYGARKINQLFDERGLEVIENLS